jgi:hypothetical protein
MNKQKISTEIICRTFNESGSVAKTAEILGYDLRHLQKRIKAECNYKLEPKDARL